MPWQAGKALAVQKVPKKSPNTSSIRKRIIYVNSRISLRACIIGIHAESGANPTVKIAMFQTAVYRSVCDIGQQID